MNLANISIKQPVFVTMMMLVLVVVGYLGYQQLSVNLFPEITNPSVSVETVYPGAGPEEVQRQVTLPLETTLSSLSGVTNLRSSSRENNSQINVEFTLETDPKLAFQTVSERVARAQQNLPSGAQQSVVSRFDFSTAPILNFAVSDASGKMKSYELRNLVVNQIQPRLERVDGVGAVNVGGGQDREIDVELNLDDLRTHRISPQQVSAAIRGENISVPGGRITEDGKDMLLRVPGEFTSMDDLNNLNITTARGSNLRLKDIATVKDTTAEVRSFTRLNGKDSVSLSVQKQSGTNTVLVAKLAKAEMDRVRRDFRGLSIVISNDQSDFIQKSIDESLRDLVLGGVFACLVVFLFFRQLRNTLVTIAGLPVIMIGTFAVMNAFGLSLNMMTLLALSLAVGLVLDDAIVVRENIFRHMERGKHPKEAARDGTNEVSLSVIAMTLTIVSVFLPIAFTTGQIGRFYREFGIAVTAAVLLSLFEAFTLAPMLSAYMFKEKKHQPGHENEETASDLGWFDRGYRRVLGWTLAHMKTTAFVGVMVLASVIVLAPLMELSFLPRIDNGNFQAGLLLPPGTNVAITNAQAKEIEAVLLSLDGVDNVFTNVGGGSNSERANFNVQLKDLSALKSVEAQVRQKLGGIKGLTFNFQGGFGGGGTNVGQRPIQINLLSSGSFDDLNKTATAVSSAMEGIPGLADIGLDTEPGKPELRIAVDRTKAALYNLSTTTMGTTIRSLVSGEVATRYRETGKEADIVVRLKPEDRSRLDDILSLTIQNQAGLQVPLRNIAAITRSSGPSVITRLNRQTRIIVGANTVGRSQAQVVADMRERLATVRMSPDITARFAGQVQQTQASLDTLLASLLLSVIFMYMVLASQFGSFTQPIVLMLALPLAIVGAFLALLITRTGADMTATIGMILLLGLAVKNSILLVDFTNRLRAEGMSRKDALLTAGPVRLRPVLMTTMALILGMLPVSLGLGAGGSFRAPMAIAVIGGLITSTVLTLLLVPVAYSLLDMGLERLKNARISIPIPALARKWGQTLQSKMPRFLRGATKLGEITEEQPQYGAGGK